MARFLCQCIAAVALGMLLFFMSCEKHPLGQMPEVQREQPDPAKVWSHNDQAEASESTSSATPLESFPQQAH